MSQSVAEFIEKFNLDYELVHKNYEQNFWATKMDLKGNSGAEETRTKSELDQFLGNKENLAQVRTMLSRTDLSEDDIKVLKCFEKTFLCYIIEDPAALELKQKIGVLESELSALRNKMNLGYIDADGKFVKSSSVQLRNTMRASESEQLRLACYEGLRSIGPFVVERFCEIVKLRNQLARLQGYACFYDMKVSQAEGFDKRTLFGILDELEERSRPILNRALEKLRVEKGENAGLPQNIGFSLSGDLTKRKDPFFPFENAVDVWARSFAALGITYKGATMRLDLCDRQGKYSNGFCHWPQPAWMSATKGWVASHANFTSLATPSAVGSGLTALTTLMHEGGHAAHFANVEQRSPLFGQERAPTSVAYAENQSMFLDSLVGDAAWQARYALNRDGVPIPWELIEEGIRSTHDYEVFALRGMLAVPYFEKRLYELPADDVTPAKVIALADEVELQIQGKLSPRPLLSVPHILSDESAAYYHGYVLAEMSVHQTRAHFLKTYGNIVDNPQVGADLARVYWQPGNSEPFMGLVQKLTGAPLSGDAWVHELNSSVEEVVSSERAAYQAGIASGAKFPAGSDSADLQMRVLLVHGDAVIADSQAEGSLAKACTVYKKWVSELSV